MRVQSYIITHRIRSSCVLYVYLWNFLLLSVFFFVKQFRSHVCDFHLLPTFFYIFWLMVMCASASAYMQYKQNTYFEQTVSFTVCVRRIMFQAIISYHDIWCICILNQKFLMLLCHAVAVLILNRLPNYINECKKHTSQIDDVITNIHTFMYIESFISDLIPHINLF